MDHSLDNLRRAARRLRKSYEAGEPAAIKRIRQHPLTKGELRHADFLYVIAREQNFDSWPKLKLAADTMGLDRAAKQQRLKIALYHGQMHVVQHLLWDTPDLAKGALGLEIALYDRHAVAAALAKDSAAAVTPLGPRRPMLHLAFSRYIHVRPELAADMLAIAQMLVDHGASVDDSMPVAADNDHPLSALYGAIGHADNMRLGRWLLENGANPNDGESLYHATELGHHEGLQMLLAHGADPSGTNALLRAMDFHDHKAVQMLLKAGAKVDDFDGTHVGGEAPWVVPALHQAARRMSDRQMIELLLDVGADPARHYQGVSAYSYARVFGNDILAKAIEGRGAAHALSPVETLLADAANGKAAGSFLDTDKLPAAYRDIIRVILHLPGKLPHVKALVALGVEYDRPDTEGLTPVQVAGWEGLPEMMGYLLSLMPDLSHVNGYGGTLLSTIIHGSENAPDRATRDHIACAKLALDHGVALPARAVELAGEPEMAEFLSDWAVRYPGQVV